MAWAYRAGSYANNGAGVVVNSGLTTTVTLGAAVSAGDMLSLHVIALNGTDTTTPSFTAISDSVNGSWSTTPDSTATSTFYHAERQSVFSFPNSGAGTPVITVTLSNAGGFPMNVGLQCAAASGLLTAAPLDVAVPGTGSSSTPSSGATGATAAANELVLGFYGDYGEGTTITEGAGYTLAGKHASDGGKYQALMEYKDSGSGGSTQTAGVTLSGAVGGWKMFAVVYKITGGAPSPPILRNTLVRQAINRASTY